MSKYVGYFWQANLFLFCASIYTSKSGLSIFGILLIAFAAFCIDWKAFAKQKILLGALALYPLAILCNLFSLGGAASSLKVAYSWPWPLLVIPAYLVYRRPQDWRVGFVGLGLGFLVACGNALYIFATVYDGVFSRSVRVVSFWDIGRWGVFLALTTLALFGLYGSQKLKKNYEKAAVLTLFVLGFACLILSNTRAPWLAFGVGFTLYCVLTPRLIKHFLGLVVLCIVFVFANPGLRDRVTSIGSVKTDESGRVTSSDASNAGRLHMWKVALDFYQEQPWFGTGFENVETPLRAFLAQQSSEYNEKYTTVEFSYRDQHSSYLGVLVQMGIVFSVFMWGYFIYVLVNLGIRVFVSRDAASILLTAVLCAHLVIFVFYGSFGSYEMISLFPFLVLGAQNRDSTIIPTAEG